MCVKAGGKRDITAHRKWHPSSSEFIIFNAYTIYVEVKYGDNLKIIMQEAK